MNVFSQSFSFFVQKTQNNRYSTLFQLDVNQIRLILLTSNSAALSTKSVLLASKPVLLASKPTPSTNKPVPLLSKVLFEALAKSVTLNIAAPPTKSVLLASKPVLLDTKPVVLASKPTPSTNKPVPLLSKVLFEGEVYIMTISSIADFEPKIRAMAVIATTTFFTSFQMVHIETFLPEPLAKAVTLNSAAPSNKSVLLASKPVLLDTKPVVLASKPIPSTNKPVPLLSKVLFEALAKAVTLNSAAPSNKSVLLASKPVLLDTKPVVFASKPTPSANKPVLLLSKVLFEGEVYIMTISSIADFEPKIRANMAVTATTIFLTIFQLYLPKPFSQKVSISMPIGTNKPRREKQKAPIKDTKGIIVGTAIPMETHTTTMTVRRVYCAIVSLSA
ncbi:unnamed protein product [Phaedon cochleariae]|uniref:Uncharacterized protein n=1 Tax=Phaedon cochleariae TaxID=80249 RepID=A0A9N9SDL9_PHACE|nr:unnamed protein product [Phaedon cochleariae]